MSLIKKYYLIISILLVGTLFRFLKLGSNPPGLYPDEAANGLDVIGIIEQGKHAVVFGTNGPRESLFIYLQGIFVWFGDLFNIDAINYTPLSLRIAPAIIGVITIYAIYLLGKELFSRNIGLFAAAAMAANPWHVQFSRNGFRAIMTPLVLVLLFYFFIKAYRDGKIKDYALSGVMLALGFYTYLSFRMVPLILLALLGYIILKDKKFISRNIKQILIFIAAFAIFMIPLFIHFAAVPGDIVGRSSASIFNPEINNGNVLKTLAINIKDTLLMFNFQGDNNFRHNFAGQPMLDPLLGGLLIVGFLLSILRFKHLEHYLLLICFAVMSLPALLTAEGMPHALRMVGTIPIVILWSAIGLDFILRKIHLKKVLITGLLLILVFTGSATIYRYFILFPDMAEARSAYSEDMVRMAEDINKTGQDRESIVISGEFGTKTISFITNSTKNSYRQIEVRDISAEIFEPGKRYKVYVSKTWYEEAEVKFKEAGLEIRQNPVRSQVTKRILYYEFEKRF